MLEQFLNAVWRRMKKISWTDRVRNEVLLHAVKEDGCMLHTINRRKTDCICCCLLIHATEGNIEGRTEATGRRGKRREQLLDDLKETTGYWKFKMEESDRTLWRTRFGRAFGSVVRRKTNESVIINGTD
jgi:hypothetical protein